MQIFLFGNKIAIAQDGDKPELLFCLISHNGRHLESEQVILKPEFLHPFNIQNVFWNQSLYHFCSYDLQTAIKMADQCASLFDLDFGVYDTSDQDGEFVYAITDCFDVSHLSITCFYTTA